MSKLNDKQLIFCREVATGAKHCDAYAKAYEYDSVTRACHANSARLMQNASIEEEIKRLRKELESELIANATELMIFLTRVVRTPGGDVGADSPLCQEYRVDEKGNTTVKMPSKIASVQELAKMIGAYAPEKSEVTHKVSMVSEILEESAEQGLEFKQ